ncbi:MAG: hypothetical protein O9267_11325 [Flavobacterium sp.]|uniref:hypothetical protein n=1 Tax=Flavobacterium sp. TaxID=239 RepID=UPI0022C9F92B|nr:hypothetical protein [Flavobacterium sp.]MCZ8198186.1 hypothetical protein [Flavobacterium sp.]
MKKSIIWMASVIMSLIVFSCINNKKPTEETTEAVSDTTEVKDEAKVTGDTANDSIKKVFATYSLQSLLEIYHQNVVIKTRSSETIAMLALREINDKHEISEGEHSTYTKNFWANDIALPKTMTKAEVVEMIKGATDLEYVKFTFDDKKNASFTHKIVNQHEFDNFISCLPVVTFKSLTKDPLFEKVEIRKAIKDIPKTTPPSTYEGKHNVAVFKAYYSNNKVQYFDIVEDPTRGK